MQQHSGWNGVYRSARKTMLSNCGLGASEDNFRRYRRQCSNFGGVTVKRLQALKASRIKLVVNIFGEVAAHVRFADSHAWGPLMGYVIEAFGTKSVVAGLLEDRCQIQRRLSLPQCRFANRPESKHKRLAGVANPFFGEIDGQVTRAIHL